MTVVDRPRTITRPFGAELLLRPANESIRPLSVIELALKVRPAPVVSGTAPVWRLEPQYDRWLMEHFPRDPVWLCPLDLYDREVRPASARYTLEEMAARLAEETERRGGYVLSDVGGWRQRTGMFVVGSHRLKALLEFLFAWG